MRHMGKHGTLEGKSGVYFAIVKSCSTGTSAFDQTYHTTTYTHFSSVANQLVLGEVRCIHSMYACPFVQASTLDTASWCAAEKRRGADSCMQEQHPSHSISST